MNPLNKQFKIPGDQIRRLIPDMGACFASDRITVDGLKVGYMLREVPDEEVFSGWTFMSGDESQDYADNPDNWAIYDVNTICNYDPSIIPYLNARYGSAFGRVAQESLKKSSLPQRSDFIARKVTAIFLSDAEGIPAA